MYPLIIIFAMGGVGLILIFFVLPKIAPIFLQMNLTLPLFSRLILKGGLFISQHAFLVMSLFFFFIASLGFALTKKAGRQATLKILSLLPAIKKLLDELDLARFCRTLSTLLSSGVPISDSLFIVMESLSQVKYQKLATNFQKEIQKGRSLSEIMREENKLFPNMVIRMIATGEKTGSVDTMLAELADHYEKEIDSALSNFTSILEPVLLLLVGIGVGVMVLAVIAPIYSLVGGIESATPGR
jgi:type IV pilus assembly protein PilC